MFLSEVGRTVYRIAKFHRWEKPDDLGPTKDTLWEAPNLEKHSGPAAVETEATISLEAAARG